MAGKAGLKAGLIGTAVMLTLTVLNRLLQVSGMWAMVSFGVSVLAYAIIGVLAGLFLAPPRTAKRGAGAGAIAGLTSALISSVVGLVILLVQWRNTGMMPGLNPQQMQQLLDSGMDVQQLLVISTACGLTGGVALGTSAAAIVGAIFSALKPD